MTRTAKNTTFEVVIDDGGRGFYFSSICVNDCACRAIANASNLDYLEVYETLKKHCKGNQTPDEHVSPRVVEKTIKELLGWPYVDTSGKDYRFKDLPRDKDLIISLSNHVTCMKKGVVYDAYDPTMKGKRKVCGYWRKPKRRTKK